MSNSTTNDLVQTWVATTDAAGHPCLEAHWGPATQSTPVHIGHAA